MSAAPLATSALDAHCHTDVGLVQCRRIVDAVAGHGRHQALPLQRLHDFEFVLRCRTGEDAHRRRQLIHLRVLQEDPTGAQSCAIHRRNGLVVLRLQDFHILGNRNRRLHVITSDHDDADARPASQLDGLGHTVAVRIDGSDEADQAQVAAASRELLVRGHVLILLVERHLGEGARGDGEHAEGR